MTTKTRNIVIIVALLLIIFALILSNPLRAVDEGTSLSVQFAAGAVEQFGRSRRLEAVLEGSGPRPGAGAFQVRVNVTEREQRYGDGAILEVTALVLITGELE